MRGMVAPVKKSPLVARMSIAGKLEGDARGETKEIGDSFTLSWHLVADAARLLVMAGADLRLM